MPSGGPLGLARVAIILALILAPAFAHSADTASTSASAAKVGQLLKGTDLKFVQKTDTIWYVPYHGKSLKDYKVIFAVENDLLVTFVTVAEKARFRLTTDSLHALARLSSKLDYVKVGLDDDGDVFVRYDCSVRVVDDQEFKAMVGQVAASADEVYKGISGFLQ